MSEQPLPPVHVSLGQRILIAFLVVAVGVLFGMGSSLYMLRDGQPPPNYGAGITQADMQRQTRAQNLMMELRMGGNIPEQYRAYMEQQAQQQALQTLHFARMAEAEGLLPQGEAREKLVRDFLKEPLGSDPSRSNFDYLADLEGTTRAVNIKDLGQSLSEQRAAEAFAARYGAAPVVDNALGGLAARQTRDQVKAVELVLSGKRFAENLRATVAADQDAINTTYEELKQTRFSIPEAIRLTVISADAATIASHVVVAEKDIQAAYERRQEEFRAPPAEGSSEPGAVKPLDDVRTQLTAEIQQDIAGTIADEMLRRLDEALEAAGLTTVGADHAAIVAQANAVRLTAADDDRISADVVLTVHEQVRAAKPAPNEALRLVLKDGEGRQLARLDGVKAGFYDRDIGTLSTVQQADDINTLYFLARIDERMPPSYRALETVQDEVIEYLAQRRAWPELYAAAQALEQAAQVGGGLRAYATAEVLAPWNASLADVTLQPLQEVERPSAELGGLAEEPYVAAALAGNPNRVVLAAQPAEGDVQRIRLLQVERYEAYQPSESEAKQAASRMRGAIGGYLGVLLDQRLREQAEQ